jgi:hypothetical protein
MEPDGTSMGRMCWTGLLQLYTKTIAYLGHLLLSIMGHNDTLCAKALRPSHRHQGEDAQCNDSFPLGGERYAQWLYCETLGEAQLRVAHAPVSDVHE